MKKLFQKLFGKSKVDDLSSIDNDFFRPILFQFPTLLKDAVSSESKITDWSKDYLSKNSNVEKYIFEACNEILLSGISYLKHNKELNIYSDQELNQGTGEVVGRNFEIEARLALRRLQELFIESWYFKELKNSQENTFRHFFLIKNLKAFYSRENNLKKFCELSSSFDTKVISEIREELNNLNLQTPFYIAKDKDYKKDSDVIYLLKSYVKLFEDATNKISEGQKVSLGESYQVYAETSEVIHGYSGGPKFNLKNYHQETQALYGRVAILASNILKHLVTIGEDAIQDKDLVEAIKGLKTDSLPDAFTLDIGDVVLVKKQIRAKITDISVSKFGCKKYKVEYVDKRGEWSWAFEQEWFLLKDLVKFPSEKADRD